MILSNIRHAGALHVASSLYGGQDEDNGLVATKEVAWECDGGKITTPTPGESTSESRTVQDPLHNLITSYYDLNGNSIDELAEEPSPLEFMRYVSRNYPFVIRGGASSWTATTSWTPELLLQHLGSQPVNVAVTPKGYVFYI